MWGVLGDLIRDVPIYRSLQNLVLKVGSENVVECLSLRGKNDPDRRSEPVPRAPPEP